MIDYLGPFIVFIGVVISLTGDTIKSNENGLKKITPTGWATVLISLLGLVVAVFSVKDSNLEKLKQKDTLLELNSKLDVSQSQLSEANASLSKSNELLNKSNSLLEQANSEINRLQSSSQRIESRQSQQEVEIRNEYLRFNHTQTKRVSALSGSIIHIYGFSCRVRIRAPEIDIGLSPGEQRQVPLVGRGGGQITAEFFALNTNSNPLQPPQECSGKIRIVGINR